MLAKDAAELLNRQQTVLFISASGLSGGQGQERLRRIFMNLYELD